jgi:hypothetical protein
LTQYTFDFQVEDTPVTFTCLSRDELDEFVRQLEEKYPSLEDIRFIHSDHIIILSEVFSTLFTQMKGNLYVYINGVEYLMDLDNSSFTEGNTHFHAKQFYKAVRRTRLTSRLKVTLFLFNVIQIILKLFIIVV